MCQLLEGKDQSLLVELGKLKDQLNQRKVDKEGWKADQTQASSILLSNIAATEQDLMYREKDDLDSNIERDADERAKLQKIMNKFFDYAKKQTKMIQDSNA